MELQTLLSKPVWQMTGEELLFLSRQSADTNTNHSPANEPAATKHYVYGIAGIWDTAKLPWMNFSYSAKNA